MAKIQLQPNNLTAAHSAMAHNIVPNSSRCGQYTPSFGAAGGNVSKKCWLHLRRLSNYMKDVSEFTNATIAAIGTGIIAPLVIMVSPGKGDKKDKLNDFMDGLIETVGKDNADKINSVFSKGYNSFINTTTFFINTRCIFFNTHNNKSINLFID